MPAKAAIVADRLLATLISSAGRPAL